MRRGTRQLGASPVLIGAVTLMVAIVAVFISYSANNGLPFVPSYQLKAEVPNGAKLVRGNEVRAGGFRVGIVRDIKSARRTVGGKERAIAVLDLRLDKQIEPLSKDTTLSVRPRSALGLKYVELIPGRSKRTYQDGDTIPLARANASAPELEDVLSTFAPKTRQDARASLEGFGNSIAGRGPALNTTVRELEPFTRDLLPVMRNQADPNTELRNFCPGLGAAAAQAAPVAEVQARWFGVMATTFAAISRDPEALRQTIEESPPTLQAATESFRVQTPFLARFAAVSRDLQPATAQLPRTLPLVNDALQAGVPAFRETPELGEEFEDLFRAAEHLGDNPSSLLGLRDLRTAVRVTRPAIEFVAPYQTVCNYLVYFFNPLGTHQSASVPGGTTERILAKLVDTHQENSLGSTESTHPADVPTDEDPQGEPVQQSLHTQYGGPAVDSNGRADCQAGQTGYPSRLVSNPRYPPDDSRGGFVGGGSHVVVDGDTPGLAGGTYKARELGIGGLGDVP
ncbi:MAG: phospholipid/cholesterol/gamma-HCH transport system substrate-binding protein [Thermoleophilaceae bacterium]|nr:phospholipid/cholesterol/gamma-HCH transport system substrate-binding protein [Thermoleophilaceae bacterium]